MLRSLVVVLTLISSTARAQVPTITDMKANIGGSEFFVGRSEGKPLIRVNLVSGVRVPGIYHVPVETTLPELLGFAGGAVEGAELETIRVRSTSVDLPQKLTVYNFYDLAEKDKAFPTLFDGDLVQIDSHGDRLTRSALIIGILATITTTTLAVMTYNRGH